MVHAAFPGESGRHRGRSPDLSRKHPHINDIRQWFANHGLTRPYDTRVLGGVCAGLGRRIGVDPWPTRLLFVIALMLIPGSQILIYPILWILMPVEQPVPAQHRDTWVG